MGRNFWVYRAAIYCDRCVPFKRFLATEHKASEDSDKYPQGPYVARFAEADSPQHCDACGDFLGNPLTADGIAYVREALADGNGDPNVLATWREFYADSLR